jgi:SAM-dependent methyltransferase
MSGFSPDWLALREPADHLAINHAVRAELRQCFEERPAIAVVDLGCGTGSNFRGLSRDLPPRQDWLLVDHDPQLLTVARDAADRGKQRVEPRDIGLETMQLDFADGDISGIVTGRDLVTAAALFDLVSEPVIQRMAAAVAAESAVFYTTLTYDGIASWLPEHPLDPFMRDAFNRHQKTDKGFGPAAGADATAALARAFSDLGYVVHRGRSPWVLGDAETVLRQAVDSGWAEAVCEIAPARTADIDGWLQRRMTTQDAVTIIGHEDLLAVPPGLQRRAR